MAVPFNQRLILNSFPQKLNLHLQNLKPKGTGYIFFSRFEDFISHANTISVKRISTYNGMYTINIK